jgi:type I site-specific restriction endonuclease
MAVVEAKKNTSTVGDGMQQALVYADMLDIPFVFSSNGDAFLLHDRTGTLGKVEQEIPLDKFPSPEFLWQKYCAWKGLDENEQKIITQDYFTDSNKPLRYYQRIAINRTIEAIAKGQNLILLVMATGTEEEKNIYKQFSPDFFDLIIIDECHRGSAAEDSAWRDILEYFSSANHIGLTATPKETKDISNIHYFGEPIYTYS